MADTLEELQRRIKSVAEIQTIVRTMKALAAVNIRQYERAARSVADYFRTVELGMHVVLRELPHVPSARHPPGRLGVIVFGSDHGLCGRFNEDIAAHARERLDKLNEDARPPLLLTVGARVAVLLEHLRVAVEENFLAPGSPDRILTIVRQILLKIDDWRETGDVASVYLLHQRPTAGGRYRAVTSRLLPVSFSRFRRLEEAPWPSPVIPTFTMASEQLFTSLLHQYFIVSLFRACAESLAAENASRLAAMQAAERNLDDRHVELLGAFRRKRQDTITSELLDVVAGYEAVANSPLARGIS